MGTSCFHRKVATDSIRDPLAADFYCSGCVVNSKWVRTQQPLPSVHKDFMRPFTRNQGVLAVQPKELMRSLEP